MSDGASHEIRNSQGGVPTNPSNHTMAGSLRTTVANTSNGLIASGTLDFGKLEDGLLQRLSRALSGIETILHNGFMTHAVSSRQVATQYQNLLRSVHALSAEVSKMSRNRVTLSPHNGGEMIALLKGVLLTCEHLATSSEHGNPEHISTGIRGAEDYISERNAYQQSAPPRINHPQKIDTLPPSSPQPFQTPTVGATMKEKESANPSPVVSPGRGDAPPLPTKSQPINNQNESSKKMMDQLEQYISGCWRDLERRGLRSTKFHLGIGGLRNAGSYGNLDEQYDRELTQFSALLDLENRTYTGDSLSTLELPVLEFLTTLIHYHQTTPPGKIVQEHHRQLIRSISLDLQNLSCYGIAVAQLNEKTVVQLLSRIEQGASERGKESIDFQVAGLKKLGLSIDASEEEIGKIIELKSKAHYTGSINGLSRLMVNCSYIAYFLGMNDLHKNFRKAGALLFEKSEGKFK